MDPLARSPDLWSLALRRLRRRGFDEDRAHLGPWFGLPPLKASAYRAVLGWLDGVSKSDASGRLAALGGWLQALQGRWDAAEPILRGALRLHEGLVEARAWLGALELMRGRGRVAKALLEQARGLDPAYPWIYVYRAALCFRSGELAAAERDVEIFQELRPGSAAGPGLRGVLCAARGEQGPTRAWLERAAAGRAPAWVQALRGSLRLRWGETEAALEDLEAAARREPSAWVLGERAKALNAVGRFASALRSLERMRRALPLSPEPDIRASDIHLDQAQYAQAARCLSRAIRLSRGDAALHHRRSRVFFVEGDLRAARVEIEAACRRAGRDGSRRTFEVERLRLCLLGGDYGTARRLLSRRGWLSAAERDYWLAYLLCRQGRLGESRELFRRAWRGGARPGGREGELAGRARFYHGVLRVLEEPAPAPGSGPELRIMGLGYRQPYQVSREVLALMRGCEIFFSNLSDSAVSDLLGLFPAPARTIVFRQDDHQSVACAREVMRGFRGARIVGVVTRGHPLFYGRLAYRLVEECRRRAIRCLTPASVSIADTITGLRPHAEGEALGLEVRDARCLEGLDGRVPLVVYNLPSPRERGGPCEALRRRYPPEFASSLLPGSGDREFVPSVCRMGELDRALERADAAVTLLLGPCPQS